MLAETEIEHPDFGALESEIAAIEAQLLEHSGRPATLENCFDHVDAVFGQPAEWIARRDIELTLDPMLIKVEGDSTRRARQLQLTEVFSCSGERRTGSSSAPASAPSVIGA